VPAPCFGVHSPVVVAQKVLAVAAQSASVVHFGLQAPATQTKLAMQSVLAVQVGDLHDPAAQITLPGHWKGEEVLQASTVPSHKDASVIVDPMQPTGAPHAVVAGANRHFPPPQNPSGPQPVVPGTAAHSVAGSVPSLTLPQVPSAASPVCVARHETQRPLQAVLQHTPSVQNPVVHWVPTVHLPPGASFATHAPL